jgi:hypothetical protein
MIDVPVNQHTGPHWKLNKQDARESDNSISVKMGRKDLRKAVERIAIDAYVMSAKVIKGEVVKKYDGFYDIGVIRCRVLKFQYDNLGLKNLELPKE